jgi:hypothetical protein
MAALIFLHKGMWVKTPEQKTTGLFIPFISLFLSLAELQNGHSEKVFDVSW